jgi:hypothetical protein
MLCDESPGQFPQDLLQLVDALHYVALPDTDARLAILMDWVHAFARLLLEDSNLAAKVKWDLDLDGMQDNPTHILYTLVVASLGCTPREIRAFMRRSFGGICATTAAAVAQEPASYGAAWLESLLYTVEGNLKCIIPANPETLNEKLTKYAGIATQDSLIGAKTCFVRQVPDMVQPAAAATTGAPRDGKRPRTLVQQPASIQEAISARVADQQRQSEKASRRDKDKRRRSGDDNVADASDPYYLYGDHPSDRIGDNQ